ncbi:MAG: substrate-binding domain-containing protein [Clostridiales bacterium]|nr:substrate-binding domain-containing protein [Clostridiales bacterium]
MKKKKILSALLALSMMFVITACGNRGKDDSSESKAQTSKAESSSTANNDTAEIKSTGPNGEAAVNATTLSLTDEEIDKIKAGKYKAAICLHYGGNDWSTSQVKGLTDTFKKLGIEIVATTDANFSAEQQVADIETVMALKPDILISIPTDAVATADAYQRAADAGIRIIFMDNVPSGFKAGENYVSCVSADNYGNGIIAADLIGEELDGKGKIGVVFYDVDFFVTNQRLEAFEKTMKDKYPDIEIVSKMGFTDTNAASSVADAMLTQNPNIDAIFAHWDVPCEGVLSSLRAGGYTNVKLSTIDLGNNIAKEIAAGTVLGLGAQLPYDQGVAEATLAAYSLLGKEAPAYVAVPAMRVDRNNILEAYTKVYHVDAPDWLKEAAE